MTLIYSGNYLVISTQKSRITRKKGCVDNTPLTLLSKVESCYEVSVLLDVFGFEIVEKTFSATDHLQKPAAGMVIMLIGSKMFVKMVDAFGQKRNLNLYGTGVAFVRCVICDDLGF